MDFFFSLSLSIFLFLFKGVGRLGVLSECLMSLIQTFIGKTCVISTVFLRLKYGSQIRPQLWPHNLRSATA